jgi:L-lactate utilization protein LutB
MNEKAENQTPERITIDKLAEMSQREFTAIRSEMVTKQDLREGLDSVRTELKAEIKAVRADLGAEIRDVRSAIDSSADHVVKEIKEYLNHHIKSLDQVSTDVEHLKSKVK